MKKDVWVIYIEGLLHPWSKQAYFVLYLKIINIFLKRYNASFTRNNLSKKFKNNLKI